MTELKKAKRTGEGPMTLKAKREIALKAQKQTFKEKLKQRYSAQIN